MTATQTATSLHNLSSDALNAAALENGEAIESANGSITVTTGKRTGRSPKDRFLVRDNITENTVDWGAVNQPIAPEIFDRLWDKANTYLDGQRHYSGQYRVGSDSALGVSVTVRTQWAWHQLFVKNLFIDDGVAVEGQAWTLVNAAELTLDPEDGIPSDGCVIINFTKQSVLLIGMHYAGEMKKSLFTALNFLLPKKDVLPMHCAANSKEDGSNLALFFGLSGTGKTTLSADPDRFLIGDDEHGWSSEGVFNFEGGCYAKCIDLSIEREPVIWNAIRKGAIMENVVLDDAKSPVFSDASLTQNTRAAYPLSHISKRVLKNSGNTPDAVLFLTCDLYGVLPPVAKLNSEQAAYYFLSGYTALVGSTEVGSAPGVKPTFSTCFGAPFFPRSPSVYAELLIKRLKEDGCPVYLVNTGWTGGAYQAGGQRFSIPTTRAVVTSIVDGTLVLGDHLPGFNIQLAAEIPGVDPTLLNPTNTWSDKAAYQEKANTLIRGFQDNFVRFTVSDAIRNSGPEILD